MTDLADLGSDRPVDTASLDRLACTDDDLQAVLTALEWARAFLASPHPDLGRKGPVCPYIRHSFDERLLHVTCRPDESCQSSDLVAAVRTTHRWFAEIQRRTPEEIRHLVTVLVVLPRIDRSSAEPLNELHRVMKDEFVGQGLMIGQFHPACEAPGLWNPDFRPLRSPIPLLAIREMVSSDLPFLIGSPMHANVYLERFARSIPAHTRRFLVEQLMEGPIGQPVGDERGTRTRPKRRQSTPRKRARAMEEGQMEQRQERRRQKRRPSSHVELDLVIPVFNEERRIGATLAAIHEEMADSDVSLNILVVDNGCVDATAEVVAGARQQPDAGRDHQLPYPRQGSRRPGGHPPIVEHPSSGTATQTSRPHPPPSTSGPTSSGPGGRWSSDRDVAQVPVTTFRRGRFGAWAASRSEPWLRG